MGDKKGELNQERLLQRAGAIHISKTPNVLTWMDFVEHGGEELLLRMQDTFTRYLLVNFTGVRKKGTNG